MLAGYLPFFDAETSKLYKKIIIGNYKSPSWISNDAKDLL
jgi:5'-AMP-activated protein kinase catalytic alpha subunit